MEEEREGGREREIKREKDRERSEGERRVMMPTFFLLIGPDWRGLTQSALPGPSSTDLVC